MMFCVCQWHRVDAIEAEVLLLRTSLLQQELAEEREEEVPDSDALVSPAMLTCTPCKPFRAPLVQCCTSSDHA